MTAAYTLASRSRNSGSILSTVSSGVCHHQPRPPVLAWPPPSSRAKAFSVGPVPRGCSDSDMNMAGMPSPQKDWSPARPARAPSKRCPVSSSMTARASPRASVMQMAPVRTVAPRPPTESMLTWATQCRYSSSQAWSAYQVLPEYRPWEWPDQKARRSPRRRWSRWGARARAISIIAALAVALSMAP